MPLIPLCRVVISAFKEPLHFLLIEQNNKIQARYGEPEVEEDLRGVCVQKYYPEVFSDYLACRAKDINSTWWEDCLGNLDTTKIKSCARGEEGRALLKENILLNKELQVVFGPTYFVDNQKTFSTQGVPAEKDFEAIFKKARK